jgi:UDP-2,4-diacetamido-2,4,6-trideoxy-beta-L-altropyranose hydrolase
MANLMLSVVFRVDCSVKIGTGHFMRCLTLAAELQNNLSHAVKVTFITRDLPNYFCDILEKNGISHYALGSTEALKSPGNLDHSDWLSVSQEIDADEVNKVLDEHSYDWLVVDHYALDSRWENLVRSKVKWLMVIDDIADRDHACDLLVDANFYLDLKTRYKHRVLKDCQLLMGPRYALLRSEFRKTRQLVKARGGKIHKVLVFFGGVDEKNYTNTVIEALASFKNLFEVVVIIGELNLNHAEVESNCKMHGFTFLIQVNDIANIMLGVDLCIGAGGTAIWERCCLGLPTITLATSSNQDQQVSDAASAGILYAPLKNADLIGMIQLHVSAMLGNPALLQRISNAAFDMVDGQGAMRVARIMNGYKIKIRRATQSDAKSIYDWRNDPSIRSASKNSNQLAWNEHEKWIERILSDTDHELLVGEINGAAIGVVRLDKLCEYYEISIYLVPDSYSKGYGPSLLLATERWLITERPEIKKIIATVLSKNEKSLKLFSDANYSRRSVIYEKELG